jgi:hypothetical protein
VSGYQTTTCHGKVTRVQLSGIQVITKDPAPGKVVTNSFSCRLKWDVDGTGMMAASANQTCTVIVGQASALVLWTGGTMRRNGDTISGTGTLAANGCSGVQYYTLTRT